MRLSLVASFIAIALAPTCMFGGTISVDEFGNLFINGVPGPHGVVGNDPGPGGLTNVLIYSIPFAGVQGDVLLLDPFRPPDPCSGSRCDVIRFNGNGTLIFYSDNVDGFDAPADTFGPPGNLYSNQLSIPEIGDEGNNGSTYTPTANQPGFDPAFAPTFTFTSDSVPEPAAWLLTLGGIGLLACRLIHVHDGHITLRAHSEQ